MYNPEFARACHRNICVPSRPVARNRCIFLKIEAYVVTSALWKKGENVASCCYLCRVKISRYCISWLYLFRRNYPSLCPRWWWDRDPGMLEDGEIAFLNGPLGEAFISDYFIFSSIWLFLYLYLQAAYLTKVRDPGLNYFGEVKRTWILATTTEAVCATHFFQLGNMALCIIQ